MESTLKSWPPIIIRTVASTGVPRLLRSDKLNAKQSGFVRVLNVQEI
jgi:hypothetical protein